jgi:hypothetical protein
MTADDMKATWAAKLTGVWRDRVDELWPLQPECGLAISEGIRQTAAAAGPPPDCAGRGIVTVCTESYLPSAYCMVRGLRSCGCRLPVEVWLPQGHPADKIAKALASFDVNVIVGAPPGPFESKTHSYRLCNFAEVLFIDADSEPMEDVTPLFDDPGYRTAGAMFWSLPWSWQRHTWQRFGFADADASRLLYMEGGHQMFDRRRCWPALVGADWANQRSDWSYRISAGSETMLVAAAWKLTGLPFQMTPSPQKIGSALCHGPGKFVHRVGCKFRLGQPYPRNDALPGEAERHAWLAEFDAEAA